MKTTTVAIRNSPLNTSRNSEALRMSLGLTILDDEVQVLFIDDGVYMLTGWKPEKVGTPSFKKHLATLETLKCSLLADRESLEARGLKQLEIKTRLVSRQEVAAILTASDYLIVY